MLLMIIERHALMRHAGSLIDYPMELKVDIRSRENLKEICGKKGSVLLMQVYLHRRNRVSSLNTK